MNLNTKSRKNSFLVVFMLVMLCILFFGLGYGYGASIKIDDINNKAVAYVEAYCTQGGTSYGNLNTNWGSDFKETLKTRR